MQLITKDGFYFCLTWKSVQANQTKVYPLLPINAPEDV